jgi:hypothetical protein
MHRVLAVAAMGGLVAAGACSDSPPLKVQGGATAPEIASPTTAQRGNLQVSQLDEAGEQPPQTISADQPETTGAPSGCIPPSVAQPIITPLTTTPPASPSGSGVQGRVAMWPSCPVESADPGCAPRPLAARVVVSRRSGERVATAGARGDGCFEVAVSPGDYVVEAQADGVMCVPVDVTVTSDRYVQVEINCDTGVR